MKKGDFIKFRFLGESYQGHIYSITKTTFQGKPYEYYMVEVENGMKFPCKPKDINQ